MPEEKKWTFAVTGNRRPINYVDKDGKIRGFDIDVAEAICRRAGKQCSFAVIPLGCVATSSSGTFTPGKALIDDEADACLSVAITPEREELFKFTEAYYRTAARFFTAPGNPTRFTPQDLQGKKISLLNGTYTNMDCLERLGLQGAIPVVGTGLQAALDNVLKGKAEALFAPRSGIPGVERVAGEYQCAKGSGVMVKKDSHLPHWWNTTFQKILENGEYKKICDSVPERHGGRYPVNCVESLLSNRNSGNS